MTIYINLPSVAVSSISLAHVEENAVRATYNHTERLAERREMMQA
jgi:hypothetical protein